AITELRQHGGLVAGASTHVEHAIFGFELEQLAGARDHVRLTDGLTLADRERAIFVRGVAHARLHETVSRYRRHPREYAFVADAASLALALRHGLALGEVLVAALSQAHGVRHEFDRAVRRT